MKELEDKNALLAMSPDDKWLLAGKLLQANCYQHNFVMAFSGGKDSVLMEALAIEFHTKVPKVYNNTTIDPPGTIKFCEKHGCEIKRPKRSFLDIVEAKGMPTMFHRFCCRELKEMYISDYLMTGVRKMESVKRSKRYNCFDGYRRWDKNHASVTFHPLVWFTDEDVAYHVDRLQLEMHPVYYKSGHEFDVKRRLGCIGCPLQSDRGRREYLMFPLLLRQVLLRLVKFHMKHGRTEKDAYLNAVYNIFYSNHGYKRYSQTYEGLFDEDPKEFLETYFHITLP